MQRIPATFLLLSLSSGLAAQAATSRAVELRNAAEAAWKQKDYRAASDHLQAAFAVYRESPGDHLADQAVVCRAICWNEVDDGHLDVAERWFATLVGLVPADAASPVLRDLGNAYGALHAGVTRAQPPTSALGTLAAARTLLLQRGHARLAAQCEHDRGTLLGNAGDLKAARTAMATAIGERQRLGDDDGLAWSNVNLAHFELAAEQIDQALPPLVRAAELFAAGRGLVAQAAHAVNLGVLLERTAAAEPSASELEGMWRLVQVLCASPQAFVMPPDRVLREVLQRDVVVRGAGKALAAARRAAACIAPSWPVEVAADVRIRVALAALAAGASGASFAQAQLAAVEVGSGPCAPHLAARRDAALAVVAAVRGKIDAYERQAEAGISAMEALGDRAMRFVLLQQVVEVPFAAGRSAVRDRFAEQLARLRLEGGPGGDGSSASMVGLGELSADAGEHMAVFLVRSASGGTVLEIKDLIGGVSRTEPLRWKPRNGNWNGCGLGLHGGYFVVRSMQYGRNGASDGAPGQAELDQLGSYLPLPGVGHWEITRNGAVRYVGGA